MNLTEIGKIAHQYFIEIPDHFPFVKIDSFVIMPNHIHGIIIIDKPEYNRIEKYIRDNPANWGNDKFYK